MRIDGLHPNAIAGAAGIRPKTPLVVFPKHIHIKPNDGLVGNLYGITIAHSSNVGDPRPHNYEDLTACWCNQEVQPTKICPTCRGIGGDVDCNDIDLTCPECNGSGHVTSLPTVQPTEVDKILKRLVGNPDSYGDIGLSAEKVWQFYNEAKEAIESYCSDRERKAAVEALHRIQYHYLRLDENGVEQRSVHPWVRYSTVHNLIAQYERGEANE